MKLIIFDLDDTLFDTSGQLDNTYSGLAEITPFPDTIFVLKTLKAKDFSLFLVSAGDQKRQKEKIKILGIENYFDQILICPAGADKEKIFIKILNDFNKHKPVLVVIGDRIDREIKFGNKLGGLTIRINQGKWKDLKPTHKLEEADYVINNLQEILELI